eukprot:11192141-Lingulodinium_polyedra.AAC.1
MLQSPRGAHEQLLYPFGGKLRGRCAGHGPFSNLLQEAHEVFIDVCPAPMGVAETCLEANVLQPMEFGCFVPVP